MKTSEFDSDRTWKIEISSTAEIMASCQLIHTGSFYSRGSRGHLRTRTSTIGNRTGTRTSCRGLFYSTIELQNI